VAVYTEVSVEQATLLFATLGLGPVTEMRGIRSGIENTNYYVSTPQGQWVLTLFERLSHEQLPYYLSLMQHLAQQGILVPAPQALPNGQLVHTVADKPAAVVTRLPGSHRLAPGASHCAQVGEMLARMHVAAQSFAGEQPHLRGLSWWHETAPQVLPHLEPAQARLLQEELKYQQQVAQSAAGHALPKGAIHADLFRDNVMFDATSGEDRLCGFFDFYFAGTDTLLFDVAVCLNDWCIDHDSGRLVEELALPFISAYMSGRALTSGEARLLPALLRAAALRFWLSRLWDWYLPRSAALLQPKDPMHFERVLRSRIENPWHAAL